MNDNTEAMVSFLLALFALATSCVLVVLLAIPAGLFAHVLWRALLLGWRLS